MQKLIAGEMESNATNVGNAFIGPNLWEKNDLFQGGVEFEHLEIDEFLNENGLNEKDMAFLDQIQKTEVIPSTTDIATVSTVFQTPINKVRLVIWNLFIHSKFK